MSDAQADYLRITAPHIRDAYIDIMRRISQFSALSDELLDKLFEYSKFMKLEDRERAIQEGTFGQNIFILIQGRLEVYVQTDSGEEKQTDVIFKPFSIFGEQCILGEPNTASVEASGEVILLAIDMSALPDLLDGWSNPGSRLEDAAYLQSLDMNTIFASVLLNRLNRLIRDQYKLVQKLLILHQSNEYQSSWKQSVLLTTIFNEFSDNLLSPKLETHRILKQTLGDAVAENEKLSQLLDVQPTDTRQVYMELVRLETLGKIDSINVILLETIQRLAARAMELEEYTRGLNLQPHNLPSMISLPDFLEEVYLVLSDSGVFQKALTEAHFLEGFLSAADPEPSHLSAYLRGGGWITDTFNMSYTMLLICQTCIRKEFELNRLIADCVTYLKSLNTPRQNVKAQQQKFLEDSHTLTRELIELYKSTMPTDGGHIRDRKAEPSAQGNVEDLLSKFGM